MRSRSKGEDGAVLALSLVFLVVFAVLIAALLGQVSVNLQTTGVVQSRADRNYTTDAAIERSLQILRLDPTKCTDAAETRLLTQFLNPKNTTNPRKATVTCQVSGSTGVLPGANGWAAIITGNLAKDAGGSANLNGPVYVGGGISAGGSLIDEGGSVYQDQGSCPATQPSGLTVRPTPPYRWQCTSIATPDAPHVLPAVPTAVGIPDPPTVGGCTIFKPGHYTAAPQLGARNYFISGVYYFDNVGPWAGNGGDEVVGGNNPSDPTNTGPGSINPCVADPEAADRAPGSHGSGYGVQWIFGGNSRLELKNNDKILLHTRAPGRTETATTPGISLQTVGANPPAGYTSTDPNLEVVATKAGHPGFASYGLIYAPHADISISGPVGNTGLGNGIVVRNLAIKLSNGGNNAFQIGLGSSATGRRFVELKAVATSSGEANLVSRAVVEIRNTTNPPTVVVRSWRTTSESP